VTKLGMGMGRNGNRLHGNGREWECKKPFPGISITNALMYHVFCMSHSIEDRNRSFELRRKAHQVYNF